MAVLRDRPYAQFNFLVDLGTGDTSSVQAGFSDVSGLGVEVDVAEYRAGNDKETAPRKLTGLSRTTDVTLKRGVIGALDLFTWLAQVRDGDPKALRTVTIQLLSEDHKGTVLTWRLSRARPVKYVGPTLKGAGRDVAIEELTLAYERLDVE